MEEYESFLFGFVKNCSTVDDCADKVNAIYDAFALDTPKNAEETKAVAKALASSAMLKM